MNQLSHLIFAFSLFVVIYTTVYAITVRLSGQSLETLLYYFVGGGVLFSIMVSIVFGLKIYKRPKAKAIKKEDRTTGNAATVISTIFVSFFIGAMGASVIHQWVYDIQILGHLSIFVGSVGVLVGAMMPDWDIPFLGIERHRNIVFHSFLLPVLIVLPTIGRIILMIVNSNLGQLETWVSPTELYILGFFFIGYASHLGLDVMPSKASPWEIVWRVISPLDEAPTGIKPLGPFKVSERHAKSWLYMNAFFLGLIAFGLLGLYYYHYYPWF